MIDLTTVPVPALLELHVDLLAELRRRKVVRSANNPTGDYGELLFSRAFGWTLNNNSSADADAVDGAALRYQIKCRTPSSSIASASSSASRSRSNRSLTEPRSAITGSGGRCWWQRKQS